MVSSQNGEPEGVGIHGVEEKEPKLTYTHIAEVLRDNLTNDSVSCVAIHSKLVCIGTEGGVIYLLDHLGNVNRTLQVHDAPVNQLSIDNNADHIASCSDDGRVLVTGLYNNCTHYQHLDLKRRVRSVAIDPFYYRSGSGRKLIIGERQLILHEKIAFSRWKQTVLEDATAEGGVKIIKSSPGGNLVLWASHRKCRIYDLVSRTSLELGQSPMKAEVDLKCHVCWKGHTVIVGWGNSVQAYAVQVKTDAQSSDASKFSVELVFSFLKDSIVCGVGAFNANIVVLGCGKFSNNINVGERPFLQVIQPDKGDCVDMGADPLSLERFEDYTASHYSLDCLPDEGQLIIVSPKDILVACPCDTDDRIDWFLEHGKYQNALDAIQQCETPPVRHTRLEVGLEFIDHLLDTKEYEKAAAYCPRIIGVNKVIWEQQLRKFAHAKQLRTVADYLPTSHTSCLATPNYDMVLNEYLQMDHEGFLKKIKQWPRRLYSHQDVVRYICSTDEFKSNPIVLEALAVLYSHMGQYDKALIIYVKLQFKGMFELIKQHNLYNVIYKIAKELMKLDSTQAIEVMVSSSEADPQLIRDALAENDYYLYLYLNELHMRRPKECTKFHADLVRLYANFEREKLMPFLRRSDLYVIHEALEVCKRMHFVEEMVYLLGRMGNTHDALTLICTEIKDIERAVDFCKEYDDEELWDDLINFSLDKPSCINTLLKGIGTYVDPRILIQRIDVKLEIPMLKDALVKMMQDYLLNVQIQEDYCKIIISDHYDLHTRQLSTRKRGIAVRYDNQCDACRNKLVIENLKDGVIPSEVAIFNCSHMFHSNCLPVEACCTICTKKLESTRKK